MNLDRYQPDFKNPESWALGERYLLEPFATNVDGLVTVLRNLPPELAGALCSRASRASESLLRVFLNEYINPIINGEDPQLAQSLKTSIRFLHRCGNGDLLNQKRAQKFFAKWLAQYGDESIMQMMGTYLVFWGVSQVSMKFLEDRRLGLAPIEKSTRFVDFGKKVCGKYLYYTDPDIVDAGLGDEYTQVMDSLFETYSEVVQALKAWFIARFPEEKQAVLEKKAFDVARGFLPMATLGQVAFFGNGQAFEYLINNCAQHELGELRWIASASRQELDKEIGSLLSRLDESKALDYQEYLAERKNKVDEISATLFDEEKMIFSFGVFAHEATVRLVEADSDGENKIIAGILFPSSDLSWDDLMASARSMEIEDKKRVIAAYLHGRTARWQKVGRAFENAYARFEIVMNAGAYRDLHRHRMLTQERQLFTIFHGYDTPIEIVEAGFKDRLDMAMEKVENLYSKIRSACGPEHAQYATTLFHRIQFYQLENIRQFFWEAELRTTSQGHPDYRVVEQKKFLLLKEKYPLLAEHMLVDMNEYDFARRGLEERAQAKEEKILSKLQ